MNTFHNIVDLVGLILPLQFYQTESRLRGRLHGLISTLLLKSSSHAVEMMVAQEVRLSMLFNG